MYWRNPAEERFDNRRHAGRALAEAFISRKANFDGVLGLTRGGVPVAYEVALAMRIPLDVVVIKKLRTPGNPELAVGAVSSDGARVLKHDIMRHVGVEERYLQREIEERIREAVADEAKYRGANPALDLRGRSIVIVDDGIATGSSVEAAVASARQREAASITVATPVGSQEACGALKKVADEVFCLTQPADFWAVGFFYRDFSQTSDEEVRQLLAQSRKAPERSGNKAA